MKIKWIAIALAISLILGVYLYFFTSDSPSYLLNSLLWKIDKMDNYQMKVTDSTGAQYLLEHKDGKTVYKDNVQTSDRKEAFNLIDVVYSLYQLEGAKISSISSQNIKDKGEIVIKQSMPQEYTIAELEEYLDRKLSPLTAQLYIDKKTFSPKKIEIQSGDGYNINIEIINNNKQ